MLLALPFESTGIFDTVATIQYFVSFEDYSDHPTVGTGGFNQAIRLIRYVVEDYVGKLQHLRASKQARLQECV